MANVDKGELMDQVKQQIAVANAQELLTQMTQKCFKKCVNKPGTSLDSSEQVGHRFIVCNCIHLIATLYITIQKCISMCMDRFMDSWNLISRTYGQRLQREQSNF